jgi:four helix bundle protein
MTTEELKNRTKQFALRVVRLYSAMPKTTEALVMGKQVLRSGTSVGAQYREATRSRSAAEFVSKIECCLQELEETIYWLELMSEAGVLKPPGPVDLLREANELTAIFVASAKTAKRYQRSA